MSITIRQGDILFIKTDKVATGKKQKQLVVAQGEFTGHNHVLIGEITGDNSHFSLTGNARLVHPEHDEITFPAGNYIVRLEAEHDYIENQMKVVRD